MLHGMCKAGKLPSLTEYNSCFKIPTASKMHLSTQIKDVKCLLDVTTTDPSSSSHALVSNFGTIPGYFPGISASRAAQRKVFKYCDIIHSHHKFYPFVLEVHGRWVYTARERFKIICSNIPLKGSRISRNFWQQRITLAYLRNTTNNIILSRCTVPTNTPVSMFFDEINFGQNIS